MVVSPRVVPTRRTYAWLAVAAMAFAIYVSLIPFRLRGLPFWPALHTFASVISTPEVGRVSRTNFLANLLLFIPIGFALIGALLVDRRPRVLRSVAAAGTTLLSGVAVSLTAEFLQMFAPGRVPARADVNAQTVGCLAGIAAWFAIGPALTLWLRGAQTRSASDRLSKALAGYAAAWTIANLAPFDVTVDLGDLSQRFHSGLITLCRSGALPRPTSRVAWDVLIAVVSAVPLGVLGLAGWTRAGRLRPAPAAFCLGAAFVAGMEVAADLRRLARRRHHGRNSRLRWAWQSACWPACACWLRGAPSRGGARTTVELGPAESLVPGAVRLPLDAVRFQPRRRDDPAANSPACRSHRSPAMRAAPTSTP